MSSSFPGPHPALRKSLSLPCHPSHVPFSLPFILLLKTIFALRCASSWAGVCHVSERGRGGEVLGCSRTSAAPSVVGLESSEVLQHGPDVCMWLLNHVSTPYNQQLLPHCMGDRGRTAGGRKGREKGRRWNQQQPRVLHLFLLSTHVPKDAGLGTLQVDKQALDQLLPPAAAACWDAH